MQDPMSPTQVVVQVSYSQDSTLAVRHEFQSQVPPEGLKNAKCKKGKLIARPPIPYVPPLDLHEKQETAQIKVKMPEETNFQMAAFGYGNNEEHLVHIIAVLRIIKQKGMETDRRKAFQALV
jgi:hypothetical protein